MKLPNLHSIGWRALDVLSTSVIILTVGITLMAFGHGVAV
jgi:hypothetical protein